MTYLGVGWQMYSSAHWRMFKMKKVIVLICLGTLLITDANLAYAGCAGKPVADCHGECWLFLFVKGRCAMDVDISGGEFCRCMGTR